MNGNWFDIALFVADCEAATAYDFIKKSAAKGETRRHKSICTDLIEMLETGELVRHRPSKKEDVIKPLKDVVRELEAKQNA